MHWPDNVLQRERENVLRYSLELISNKRVTNNAPKIIHLDSVRHRFPIRPLFNYNYINEIMRSYCRISYRVHIHITVHNYNIVQLKTQFISFQISTLSFARQ